MKKILVMILTVAILASAMLITASAANYEESAAKLNGIGLFRGTDAGFELDRAPTRAEAVTMLVRFLGLEEESQSGEYTHPFTDVPNWASDAVAIAYEKGYTTGVSDTAFNPNGACSAQMYVTFILRALGYSDESVDSTLWEEAIAFGKQIGVVDDIILSETFMRGNMTAVSYLALAVPPADGEYGCLLEKLVADGAVDPDKAAPILDIFKLLGEFSEIDSDTTKEVSIAMTMAMDMEMTYQGETMPAFMNLDISMIIDSDNIELAMVMETSVDGENVAMEIYVDGSDIYISAEGQKLKVPLGEDVGMDINDLMSMADLGEMADMSGYPIYMVKGLTKASEDGLTAYTFEISGGSMTAIVEEVFAMLGGSMGIDSVGDITVGDIAVAYYFDDAGALKRLDMSIDMSMDVEGSPMSIQMALECEIIAMGDGVEVKYPDDLDTYMDLEALMAAMADAAA